MNNNGLGSANLIDDMQEMTKENTYDSCLVSSDRTNNNNKEIKKKKVKFSDEVVFIDVECWKQYNVEQTANEPGDIHWVDPEEIKEEEKNIKSDKNNTNNNGSKPREKEKIFCSCGVV